MYNRKPASMLARKKRNRSWIGWVIAGLFVLGLLVLLLSALGDDESTASAPVNTSSAPTRTTPKPTVAPTRVASASTSATPATAGSSADHSEWTVLVYLDGDNDLEQDAIGDFAEMAS